ncbi:MAG: DoxX family protein [Candidatus Caenarcaniphilales bacterium]|nr:DoxX family protein [Candidatus Caenarcaniphilales bacterium]
MEEMISKIFKQANQLQDLSLLVIRLLLAYGLYEPALKKISNFESIVVWFDKSLHLPFPWLNALLATSTEIAGIILLVLGLMTRLISIPLMVIMIVAITVVHGSHGFSASDNGFEIPLYYFVMLFVLLSHGAGAFSLDKLIFKDSAKNS